MGIELHCKCGHQFGVSAEKAGTLVECPVCKSTIYVTRPADGAGIMSLGESGGRDDEISRELSSDEMLKLREERIPALPIATAPDTGPVVMDSDVQVSGPTDETLPDSRTGEVLEPPEASDAAEPAGGYGVSFDDAPAVERRRYERCPQCDGPLDPDTVVCTACGFNLDTGERVERVSVEEAELGAAERAVSVGQGLLVFLAKWTVKLRFAVIALAIIGAGIIVVTRFVARHAWKNAYFAEISGGGMVADWYIAAQRAVEQEAYDLERRTQEQIQMAMVRLNNEPQAEQGVFCPESKAAAREAFLRAREAFLEGREAYEGDVRRSQLLRAERLYVAIDVLYGALKPQGAGARQELTRVRAALGAAVSRPTTRPAARPTTRSASQPASRPTTRP